ETEGRCGMGREKEWGGNLNSKVTKGTKGERRTDARNRMQDGDRLPPRRRRLRRPATSANRKQHLATLNNGWGRILNSESRRGNYNRRERRDLKAEKHRTSNIERRTPNRRGEQAEA